MEIINRTLESIGVHLSSQDDSDDEVEHDKDDESAELEARLSKDDSDDKAEDDQDDESAELEARLNALKRKY